MSLAHRSRKFLVQVAMFKKDEVVNCLRNLEKSHACRNPRSVFYDTQVVGRAHGMLFDDTKEEEKQKNDYCCHQQKRGQDWRKL